MSFKLRKISPICSAFKYESNQRVHWTNIYPLCKVPQQSPSSLAVNASGSGLCGLAISDIAVRMMPSALTSCSAGGRLTAYKKVAAVSLHSLIPASRQQKGAHTADMERRSWNLFLKHFYMDPGPPCCQRPCSLHDNSGPRCGKKPRITYITGTPARHTRGLKETDSEYASTVKKLKKKAQGLMQILICKSSRGQEQLPLRS